MSLDANATYGPDGHSFVIYKFRTWKCQDCSDLVDEDVLEDWYRYGRAIPLPACRGSVGQPKAAAVTGLGGGTPAPHSKLNTAATVYEPHTEHEFVWIGSSPAGNDTWQCLGCQGYCLDSFITASWSQYTTKCSNPYSNRSPATGPKVYLPAPPAPIKVLASSLVPLGAFTLSTPSYSVKVTGVSWNDPAATTATAKKYCEKCDVEWCEYLDAYYGSERWLNDYCARCRKNAGRVAEVTP